MSTSAHPCPCRLEEPSQLFSPPCSSSLVTAEPLPQHPSHLLLMHLLPHSLSEWPLALDT